MSSVEPIFSTLADDPDNGQPLSKSEIKELVLLYVEEMPRRIAELRQAFDAGDSDLLVRQVHQMKGAAGSYGFQPLSDCAAVVESELKEAETEEEISASIQSLIEICSRLRACEH